MPRRKIVRPQEDPGDANAPAQQDEGDILAEVGAEPDDESGDLKVSEEQILEVGAVDAETVRENRRLQGAVNRRRANVKNVSFNAGDLLTKYETIIKCWPANTLDIGVKRLTGPPVQQIITSRPRSGSELYEALKVVHGQYGEADYEIKFFDTNLKVYRGTGRITMPDMRATTPQQQQGQPMNPFYPSAPPGYPSGYPSPPPGYPPPVYPPQPPIAAAAAPSPPPPPQQQPQ